MGNYISIIIREDDVRQMQMESREACRADLINYHDMILIGDETPGARPLPKRTTLEEAISAIADFGEHCIVIDIESLCDKRPETAPESQMTARCDKCGSANVHKSAWAAWDDETQAWVLGGTHDDCQCADCSAEGDDIAVMHWVENAPPVDDQGRPIKAAVEPAAPPETHVACASCNWEGPADECDGYRDFWSRAQPGEIIPHGDCPKCGAFCYEAKAEDAVK